MTILLMGSLMRLGTICAGSWQRSVLRWLSGSKLLMKSFALQYIKLAAKLLGLSLRPKKLGDLEEIKKALKLQDAKSPE